jgi:hypothetical protein
MSIPTGQYGDITVAYGIFGQNNIVLWSDFSNSTPPVENQTVEQNALNWADGKIAMMFRNSRYKTPLVCNDTNTLSVVQNWEAVYVAVQLYGRYGFRDDDLNYNRIQHELKRVQTEVTQILISQYQLNCSLNGNTPTVPAVIAVLG